MLSKVIDSFILEFKSDVQKTLPNRNQNEALISETKDVIRTLERRCRALHCTLDYRLQNNMLIRLRDDQILTFVRWLLYRKIERSVNE